MRRGADGMSSRTPAAVPTLEPGMYKLLGHPLRHEILLRLGDGPASPGQLTELIGESPRRICDQLEVLKKNGLVELVEERPGPRGGVVHIYKAVERFVVDAEEWAELPPAAQARSEITIFSLLQGEAARALDDGCFYRHPRHVLIRRPMWVDEDGMQELDEIYCRADREAHEVERVSAERRRNAGGQPIRVVTALLSFPAAPADR